MNALCCVCATVRTVKMTRKGAYRPPNFESQTGTCDLKCQGCRRVTRHAVILSDSDEREHHLARRSADDGRAGLASGPGVKVCRSAELEQDALWIASHRILLVHSSATAEDVADLLDRIAR